MSKRNQPLKGFTQSSDKITFAHWEDFWQWRMSWNWTRRWLGVQLEHASASFQVRDGDDTMTRLGAVRVKGDETHRTR